MFRLLLTLGIGLPILGGVFAWHGFKERDIAQASSETPDTLPLNQLSRVDRTGTRTSS